MKINIKQSLLALLAVPTLALGVVGAVTVPAYAVCDTSGGTPSITDAAGCSKATGAPDSLTGDTGVFKKIADVLLFIIGAVSVIMLIIGGIRYVISQGDAKQIESAKNTILYAVIGIVVALLAYAIVTFVVNSFATQG